MKEFAIQLYDVFEDGLPPEDALNTAFLFDGCIVSGWPVHRDHERPLASTWEANEDVGKHGLFTEVKYWFYLPKEMVFMSTIQWTHEHPVVLKHPLIRTDVP